jgi:hypothetical protein
MKGLLSRRLPFLHQGALTIAALLILEFEGFSKLFLILVFRSVSSSEMNCVRSAYPAASGALNDR